jgi:hypothetical protein
VVWQTCTNAAIRQMPLDKFTRWLRNGLTLGRSLGADFVLMNLQFVPAVGRPQRPDDPRRHLRLRLAGGPRRGGRLELVWLRADRALSDFAEGCPRSATRAIRGR